MANEVARIEGHFGEWYDTVLLNGKPLSPERSLEVENHSPDGFTWGYRGSGPTQLALAILLEFTGKETALRNYMQFRDEHVARWRKDFDVTILMTRYIHVY